VHIGQYWHEIGIANPSGHYVHVGMVCNTGASNSTYIRANVKPVGLHG